MHSGSERSKPVEGTFSIRVVFTDASATGFAGYTVEHGCHIAHGQWKEEERAKSSTWREMAAVDRVLKALGGGGGCLGSVG